MNKQDKHFYKALKFFSGKTLQKIFNMKKDNPSDYNKIIPLPIEDILHKIGYISFATEEEKRHISAITPTGVEQLRILEDIKRKELTLIVSVIVSVIAMIISLVALAKSMGWI